MRTTTRTAHARRAARTHRVAARRTIGRPSWSNTTPRLERSMQRSVVLRLTRRGRALVLLVLVGLLFAAFSLGRSGSSVGATGQTSPAAPTAQTTVQPGESLWTVATRIAPESDPRDVVQQLRRLNDLPGSQLRAGQQLLLPA